MTHKRILFVGESWISTTIHAKGFDTFQTTKYEEGATALIKALRDNGYDVTYYPCHIAQDHLPYTKPEFDAFDLVILSDIGSNTLLLPDKTFSQGVSFPNRCDSLRDYVIGGGGLVMIGEYMSFCGIDAKARYGSTSIQDVLPVQCLEFDDRSEHPEGIIPEVISQHPILSGIDGSWPALLGYNKTLPKDNCPVVAQIGGDPFIAVGSFGRGSSVVFTSDCSPHWGSHAFMSWEHYNRLWLNIVDFVAGARR